MFKENKIIEYIGTAVEKGRLPHALIINGPGARAKEELTDHIAAALLCSERKPGTFTACGSCPSCIKAESHNHPDIIYLTHEKEKLISVQEVREQLVDDMAIKPYYGGYKIYIVPDAELMNENGQNALLKSIEEPPSYAVIFLLTDNADAFLPTIKSRCVILNTEAVSKKQQGEELLQAAGHECVDILLKIKDMNAVQIDEIAAAWDKQADKNSIIAFFTAWFRDVLVYKATADEKRLFFCREKDIIIKESSSLRYEDINEILKAVDDAGERLKFSVKAEAVWENLLLMIRKKMRSGQGRGPEKERQMEREYRW